VIQRAISDGAFRRQLQSDPATALRGFNLTADEIAAIRSGDSSKLMSLGVDQRMSKAYTVGGGFLGASRSTGSDLSAGGSASTLANDPTAGAREGIVGDPTSNARDAHTTGTLSGTRAVNDVAPFEGNVNAITDPTASGTRAIHDDAPADLRSAASTGDLSGTRAVNDVAPFGSAGTSAIEDPNAPEFRAAESTGDLSGTRAVNDVAPFGSSGTSAVEDPNAPEFGTTISDSGFVTRAVRESEPFNSNAAVDDNITAAGAGRGSSLAGDMTVGRAINDSEPFNSGTAVDDSIAAAGAGRGGSLAGDMSGTGASAAQDPFSGTYQGVSPDFQARLGQAAASDDTAGSGGNAIAADDNYAVSSRMAEGGDATAIRPIHDVEPFEGNANAAAPSGEFLGGDARLDPGTDSAHGFVPADSADVQREMLEGGDHGNAIGNTESGDEHSWG
jgi:hypothetical protein